LAYTKAPTSCSPNPTSEQNVQNKVPPTNCTIEFIALSPPNKRPKTIPKSLTQLMGCVSNNKNPCKSLPIIPIPNQHEIQLGGLKSGEEFRNACNQYLKCVDAKAHVRVTFSWDPLKLFSLVSYMLRKYDWLSNFIDDFKKQLAIYRALPKGSWAEQIDNIQC
jgi:hypothetical protein